MEEKGVPDTLAPFIGLGTVYIAFDEDVGWFAQWQGHPDGSRRMLESLFDLQDIDEVLSWARMRSSRIEVKIFSQVDENRRTARYWAGEGEPPDDMRGKPLPSFDPEGFRDLGRA